MGSVVPIFSQELSGGLGTHPLAAGSRARPPAHPPGLCEGKDSLSLHTGKCKSTRENAGAAVSLLSRGPEEEAETRSLSLTFRPIMTA